MASSARRRRNPDLLAEKTLALSSYEPPSPTKEWLGELEERNTRYVIKESTEDALADADVIYMEPVVQADYSASRQEATVDRALTPPQYRVTRDLLRRKAKPSAIILHSLP